MHLPPIILDLAVILMVAGVMTLLFRALHQPVVLGYIVAGFLVGPHFTWAPTVVDNENVKVWADIGVIFLLFALGLEFSFKKLARVGAPASITALFEVVGMVFIGFFVGQLFGWSRIDSMFLGGILAISSTTIIIRAFDELQMKTHGFVRLVFGVLIVEDLFAILLMVILSTIAVSQVFSGLEVGIAGLKLVFFLALWFILGIFLIPTFFKRVKKFLHPETLLIVSIGFCFLMVVITTKVGFSPALGAFIMGSILAETLEGQRIEHLINPVKDLFGAVFFVSVGMLIDPHVLVQYATPILVITLATIVGKLFTTTVGSLFAGQSLKHSVQAGMSLAQIGEFSFIIAGLGLSLKVTSAFLYPIAISVSVVTTFTSPYLIRSSNSFVNFLEKKLPSKWINTLERFRAASETVSQTNDWKSFIKKSGFKMLINSVVVVAVFLFVSEWIFPWLETQGWSNFIIQVFSLFIAFLCSAPFIWAIASGNVKEKIANALWYEQRFRGPLFVFQLFRLVFAVLLCAMLASRIVAPGLVLIFVCCLVIATVYLLPRYFKQVHTLIEKRFVTNLNQKEEIEKTKALPDLAPWDSHLSEVMISADSLLVGKTLSELRIREQYAVSIAIIVRGKKVIPAPGKDDVLYPADVLQVIGSDEQIANFRKVCEVTMSDLTEMPDFLYELKPVYIDHESSYVNKTIRDCGIREKIQGLVVGIEKQGVRKLNPDSSTMIDSGDVLWIVGNQNLIMKV